MENTKKTVEILNDLIEINNDRVKGFEKALGDVEDDAELKAIFTEKIGESHHFKMQLAKEVEVLGGDAEQGTSFSGTLHRNWLDMRAKFSGHSEHSILEDCEFGEDAILKAYKSAIADEHLPAYLRDMLNDQLVVLQASHDEIKALRDSTIH